MTDIAEGQGAARAIGRKLGALYLAMSIPAAIDLMLVRRTLIVPGDAEATAMNLLGGELFFRAGMALELASGILALVLAAHYYRALAHVDRPLARLLALFVIAGSIFQTMTGALGSLALTFVKQPDFLLPFETEQLNALAQSVVTFQGFGYAVAQIFWGLWLLPLGLLVIRARAAPKAIGLLLIVAGCVYVLGSFTAALLPSYARTFALWAMIPEAIGEGGFILWTMVFGLQLPGLETATGSRPATASSG